MSTTTVKFEDFIPKQLTWDHFKPQPANQWEMSTETVTLPTSKIIIMGHPFQGLITCKIFTNLKTSQKFLIAVSLADKITNQKKESKVEHAFNCIVRCPGILVSRVVYLALKQIALVLKTATLYHFWKKIEGENSYSLKNRVLMAGRDLLAIGAVPVVLIALEVIAIYGFFDANNGRMLNHNIQYFVYGSLAAGYSSSYTLGIREVFAKIAFKQAVSDALNNGEAIVTVS